MNSEEELKDEEWGPGEADDLISPEDGFVIDSVGKSANPSFSDEGIEYYRFVR